MGHGTEEYALHRIVEAEDRPVHRLKRIVGLFEFGDRIRILGRGDWAQPHRATAAAITVQRITRLEKFVLCMAVPETRASDPNSAIMRNSIVPAKSLALDSFR